MGEGGRQCQCYQAQLVAVRCCCCCLNKRIQGDTVVASFWRRGKEVLQREGGEEGGVTKEVSFGVKIFFVWCFFYY